MASVLRKEGWGTSCRGKHEPFLGLWQLHQELFPCHWDVPTQDITSAAPDIPMAVPSSSPAAILQEPPFSGGQRAAGSQEQPQGGREEEEGLEKAPHHVGLPAIDVNTAVNAPPEIIL